MSMRRRGGDTLGLEFMARGVLIWDGIPREGALFFME